MSQTVANDATPPPRRFFRDSKLIGGTAAAFHHFGLDAMAYRFGAAFLVLFLIYNPTRYCYYSWVLPDGVAPLREWAIGNPLKIIAAVPLIWAVYYGVRVTQRSLGREALVLVTVGIAILFVVFFWETSIAFTGNIAVLCVEGGLALLVMIGLLSANWNRRMSGQIMTNQAGPIQLDGHGHHG